MKSRNTKLVVKNRCFFLLVFCACDSDLRNLISKLEHDSVLAIEWFECKHMKLNQGKCHLLISRYKYKSVLVNVGSLKTWESNHQKLLGVNIDHNLQFNYYIFDQANKQTESQVH